MQASSDVCVTRKCAHPYCGLSFYATSVAQCSLQCDAQVCFLVRAVCKYPIIMLSEKQKGGA